jgi:hypothetical protein
LSLEWISFVDGNYSPGEKAKAVVMFANPVEKCLELSFKQDLVNAIEKHGEKVGSTLN